MIDPRGKDDVAALPNERVVRMAILRRSWQVWIDEEASPSHGEKTFLIFSFLFSHFLQKIHPHTLLPPKTSRLSFPTSEVKFFSRPCEIAFVKVHAPNSVGHKCRLR